MKMKLNLLSVLPISVLLLRTSTGKTTSDIRDVLVTPHGEQLLSKTDIIRSFSSTHLDKDNDSSGESSPNEHQKAMFDWVRSKGGFVHHGLEFRRYNDDPKAPFGLFTNKSILKDETILVIPRECTIHSPIPEEYCLAGYALDRELALGNSSLFAPYVNYLLDTQPYGQLPCTFTRAGKTMLTTMIPDGKTAGTPHQDYSADITSWDFFSHCNIGPEHEYAFQLLRQRSWSDILIPVYDMMSHTNDPSILNTQCDQVQGARNIKVVASRTIMPEEELFLSYTNFPGSEDMHDWYGVTEMVRDFGFIPALPQRWVISAGSKNASKTFAFELQNANEKISGGERRTAVEWIYQPPTKQQIEFGETLLDHLKQFASEKLSTNQKNVPQHERDLIVQYNQAFVSALEAAIWTSEFGQIDSSQAYSDKVKTGVYFSSESEECQLNLDSVADVSKIITKSVEMAGLKVFSNPVSSSTANAGPDKPLIFLMEEGYLAVWLYPRQKIFEFDIYLRKYTETIRIVKENLISSFGCMEDTEAMSLYDTSTNQDEQTLDDMINESVAIIDALSFKMSNADGQIAVMCPDEGTCETYERLKIEFKQTNQKIVAIHDCASSKSSLDEKRKCYENTRRRLEEEVISSWQPFRGIFFDPRSSNEMCLILRKLWERNISYQLNGETKAMLDKHLVFIASWLSDSHPWQKNKLSSLRKGFSSSRSTYYSERIIKNQNSSSTLGFLSVDMELHVQDKIFTLTTKESDARKDTKGILTETAKDQLSGVSNAMPLEPPSSFHLRLDRAIYQRPSVHDVVEVFHFDDQTVYLGVVLAANKDDTFDIAYDDETTELKVESGRIHRIPRMTSFVNDDLIIIHNEEYQGDEWTEARVTKVGEDHDGKVTIDLMYFDGDIEHDIDPTERIIQPVLEGLIEEYVPSFGHVNAPDLTRKILTEAIEDIVGKVVPVFKYPHDNESDAITIAAVWEKGTLITEWNGKERLSIHLHGNLPNGGPIVPQLQERLAPIRLVVTY